MYSHVKKLDALRGLTAQPVATSHAASLLFAPSVGMEALGWAAHFSVLVFFVLSGYSISGGLIQEIRRSGKLDLRDYAIRRIARIYPPYLMTILLVAAFFASPFSETDLINASRYDRSLSAVLGSLVFAFRGNDAIIFTPVWSLRIEVGLYILAGIFFYAHTLIERRRVIWFALGLLLAGLLCWKLSYGFTAIVAFCLGGSIYVIVDRHPPQKEEAMFWDFLAPIGGWSYTLYLIHMPVIVVAMEVLSGIVADRILLVAISVLASNFVAFILARLVERPREIADFLRRILAMPSKIRSNPKPLA